MTAATFADTVTYSQRCRLLVPLDWPVCRPPSRQLHRMLVSLADLVEVVAAAHRLATGLAVLPEPPEPGWTAALRDLDATAVDSTDSTVLARQLTDHGLHEAAELLRRGLHHRLQALQTLRDAVDTGRLIALDHQHVIGLLINVADELDQAGTALAAADHAVITAARKAHL